MKRERKELAVGTTEQAAIADFNMATGATFNRDKHELIEDPHNGLWSIFHRRKPTDRTIKRPITREARHPYSNGYGRNGRRPVVVTLLPHELIETRLKGTRHRYTISWDDLHAYLVRKFALAAMRAKQIERAAKRKARAKK